MIRATASSDDATTERELQAAIVQAAHLYGWMVHHCRPAVSRSGRWATHIEGDAGFPDLVLARKGRVLFVEVKRQTGALTQEQQRWAFELFNQDEGRTHSSIIARPADLDFILHLLASEEPW